jgi:hypothetical protein
MAGIRNNPNVGSDHKKGSKKGGNHDTEALKAFATLGIICLVLITF